MVDVNLNLSGSGNSNDYGAKINQAIEIQGNIDLNKANPIFHNFPIITRNMGQLYVRLYMENFLRNLNIVYLNKQKHHGTGSATANVTIPKDTTKIRFNVSDTNLYTVVTDDVVLNNSVSNINITGISGVEYLPYQRLPADKADYVYLDGELWKVRLINASGMTFTSALNFNSQTQSIMNLTDIDWRRFEIHKLEFDIEDYDDIKASQARAGVFKFPVHYFNSKNFDQTNASSASANALQTTLNAPNIDRIFITFPFMPQYPTFLPTLPSLDINPQINNNPILPITEDDLDLRAVSRIGSVYVDTDKVAIPSDLYNSMLIPLSGQHLYLKNSTTYGAQGGFSALQKGADKKLMPVMIPNKYAYALELNEGGCFRKGFNSVIDGHYTPTLPFNFQQNLTTDSVYYSTSETTVVSVNDQTIFGSPNDYMACTTFFNPYYSQAVASVHCLCDYVFFMKFDQFGNMYDFGITPYNDERGN